MKLTVRLDPKLEKRFNATVRQQRITKTEVMTQLLVNYVAAREPQSAHEIAEEVGAFAEPFEKTPPDLAINVRNYLVAALKAKHKR